MVACTRKVQQDRPVQGEGRRQLGPHQSLVHKLLPMALVAPNFPAGQGEQELAPALLNWPAGQGDASAVMVPAGQMYPAGHCPTHWSLVCPVTLPYLGQKARKHTHALAWTRAYHHKQRNTTR
jgi:hypothetical protein